MVPWLISGAAVLSGVLALMRPSLWAFAGAGIINAGAAYFWLVRL